MFQNVEAWSHDEVAKLLNVIKREGAALERVFDALPDCIAVVTREGKVQVANMAMLQAFPEPEAVFPQVAPRIEVALHERKAQQDFAVHAGGSLLRGSLYPFGGNAVLLIAQEEEFAKLSQSPATAAPGHWTADALERVCGQIAHRLNGLLTVILSYAEIIGEQYRTVEPLQQDLNSIKEAAAGAAKVTQDLLAFSGGLPSEPEVFEIDRVLAGLAPVLKSAATGLRVSILPGAPGARIQMNPRQFETIILNLVSNAKEAIGDSAGSITIATARSEGFGGWVRLRISDTGPGLTDEARMRALEPFYTTKPGRAGMGLAVAYGIAKRSGAVLRVNGPVGGGAEIEICFPEQPPSDIKWVMENP